MRKHITVILLLLCSIVAMAQRRGYYGRAGGIFTVSLHVKDSLSGENVSFASVYLKPAKDTIITNFTLSDHEGNAVLDGVTRGQYTLNVELMGYKPFVRAMYLSDHTKVGTILLQEDAEMLKAAKVSAALSPMEIKGDTLVYNAAAFSISQNDMLKDLLKKMPGIQVEDNGTVTVQGETVSQITVNGKTFFMGDKRAALDNLPASVVNKVKVADNESDLSRFTGIRKGGGSKDKTMDVELKQEFKKGVFGNLRASGGASIPSEGQDEMVAELPFLWNASGLLSSFRDKDQITLLARGQNISVSDSPSAGKGSGITTSRQAGTNWTTDRVKNVDTGVSVYYNGRSRENASREVSSDYPASGEEVDSEKSSNSLSGNDALNASLNMRSRKIKGITFYLQQDFNYGRGTSSGNSASSSSIDGGLTNKSVSNNSSESRDLSSKGNFHLGYKRFEKKGRSVVLSGNYSLGSSNGNSREYTRTDYTVSGSSIVKDLRYDNTGSNASGLFRLSYVEPLGGDFLLQTTLSAGLENYRRERIAYDADGSANDYYTSASRNSGTSGQGSMLLQYNNKKVSFQAGLSSYADNLYKYSRNLGVETELGKDEWQWRWAPFLYLSYKGFRFIYNGNSVQPSNNDLMPVLNITNPLRISTGNSYLKPYFSHSGEIGYDLGKSSENGRRRRPERGSASNFLTFRLKADVEQGSIVVASWYDADRVQYRVPVNARKPALVINPSITANKAFGPKDKWQLSFYGSARFRQSVNYQAQGTLAGMDIDAFDYSSFMASFWGNASGNRFYSGASGFKESLTRQLNYAPDITLRYRDDDNLEVSVSNSFAGNHVWYSLDKKSDSDTYEYSLSVNASYTTPDKYKLSAFYRFNHYFGFSDSFADRTHDLNISIFKDIKAFTISLQARDILNNGMTIAHDVSATGVTDSYSLSIGRHILLGITWNFGKMNSSRLARANNAATQMKSYGYFGL